MLNTDETRLVCTPQRPGGGGKEKGEILAMQNLNKTTITTGCNRAVKRAEVLGSVAGRSLKEQSAGKRRRRPSARCDSR